MGFGKITWKVLGLPAASCRLKKAQEAKGARCVQISQVLPFCCSLSP